MSAPPKIRRPKTHLALAVIAAAALVPAAAVLVFTSGVLLPQNTWRSGTTLVSLSEDGTLRVKAGWWFTVELFRNGVEFTGRGAMAMNAYGEEWTTNYLFGEKRGKNPPWYDHRSSITALIIDDGVTHIGRNAFAGLSGITSVFIPNSVKYIGHEAFAGCTGLATVTVTKSVAYIGAGAFGGPGLMSINVYESNPAYSSLDGVLFNKAKDTLIVYPCGKQGPYTIPKGVVSIEKFAGSQFSGCTGLTSITIPASVANIAEKTFGPGLTYITVHEDNPAYSSLGGVLFNKAKDTLKEYPAGREYPYTIPDGVKHIGARAFSGAAGLTSVTLPKSVASIGFGAFMDCSGLVSITIQNPLPPQLPEIDTYDTFRRKTAVERQCFYVPEGSIDAYRSAEGWNQFGCIRPIPPDNGGSAAVKNRPLSIHDIAGTYQLDRIENPWLEDDVRENIKRELIPSHNIFIIGKDYYILAGYKMETDFIVRKIEEEGFVPMEPAKISKHTSEFYMLFPEIPRLFDRVFTCYGRIWVIEVLNYDTVVIMVSNSFLLYRRVE